MHLINLWKTDLIFLFDKNFFSFFLRSIEEREEGKENTTQKPQIKLSNRRTRRVLNSGLQPLAGA